MRKYILHLCSLILVAMTILTSCEEIIYQEAKEKYNETTYTIAVILPMQNKAYKERWERTAQWAKENFEHAQTGLDNRVRLNIEWIEEEASDQEELYLSTIAQQLAMREDVKIVIGPRTSEHVDIVAKQLGRRKKMMIAPTATSAEILRKYSAKGFFWALCEPDITQCEVLLTKAQGYGAQNVGLIASSGIYGQTFVDWFAFQAEEMGMNVTGLYAPEEAEEALESEADYLVCVPDNIDEMIDLLSNAKAHREGAPRMLFSDIALDPTLLAHKEVAERVEGVSPYADPASGFEIGYVARFGTTPSFVEVQLFDALMLSEVVLSEYNNQLLAGQTFEDENMAINDIMCALMAIEGDDGTPLPRVNAWTNEGMYYVLHNPYKYNISGASGTLDFDVTIQSPVTHSVYCHWMVYENNFLPLDFLSTEGSKRTSSTTAAWEWTSSITQELTDVEVGIEYESLESQWAVLVCGSRGWFNYRHQADVLNMYHLLRRKGYSDDHIIIVATPSDLINDQRNPYPGDIHSTIDGPNLYSALEIDYSADSLVAEDICKILTGKESTHLPKTLHTDEHSNVLFYWSGHGEFGKFLWGHSTKHFTSDMLRSTVREMKDNHMFRKMLICGEPCYSGSVLNAVEGIPAVLCLASANTRESSFADIFDTDMDVWLSDRFSNCIISEIDKNPDQSFRQLYLTLVHDTYGSHVNIINYSLFDNLYRATPSEFFVVRNK